MDPNFFQQILEKASLLEGVLLLGLWRAFSEIRKLHQQALTWRENLLREQESELNRLRHSKD